MSYSLNSSKGVIQGGLYRDYFEASKGDTRSLD